MKQATRRVDPIRRAEIGAEKRLRTRRLLLKTARELFGHEHGATTRIEDICERAGVARGTFYNHFGSIELLQDALAAELSSDFDSAVHVAFDALTSAAERTSAAIRYYMHQALRDREWGWAMVNTGMGRSLFGDEVSERVLATIQEGIDSGEFSITDAKLGRDLLLGTGLAAIISLLLGRAADDYPERVAERILVGMGIADRLAHELVARPLPTLEFSPSDAPADKVP